MSESDALYHLSSCIDTSGIEGAKLRVVTAPIRACSVSYPRREHYRSHPFHAYLSNITIHNFREERPVVRIFLDLSILCPAE